MTETSDPRVPAVALACGEEGAPTGTAAIREAARQLLGRAVTAIEDIGETIDGFAPCAAERDTARGE